MSTSLAAVESTRARDGLAKALLDAAWRVRVAESLLTIERAVAELG